jgi:hypothetical protein
MTFTNQKSSPDDLYERFKWTHTSAGLWERAIDECEGFYAYFCRDPADRDKAGFPVTGCASFELQQDGEYDLGARSENAFRRAWAALGLECPALCSWIEFDKGSERWRKFCEPQGSGRGLFVDVGGALSHASPGMVPAVDRDDMWCLEAMLLEQDT